MRSATTVATATAVAIQLALAVSGLVAQSRPKQIVLLLVVHTKATVHPVLVTLVVAAVVNAKLDTRLTVWARASKTLSTQIGSAMATATMVHMFHPIMATADLQA